MRQLASAWWGMTACGGNYAVRFSGQIPSGLGAWSTWTSPLGPNDETGDPSQFTDCAITFNAEWFGTSQQAWGDWLDFCTVFLHEYGHITGHAHSTDPRNIMYPTLSEYTMPSVCITDPRGVPDGAPIDPGSLAAYHT